MNALVLYTKPIILLYELVFKVLDVSHDFFHVFCVYLLWLGVKSFLIRFYFFNLGKSFLLQTVEFTHLLIIKAGEMFYLFRFLVLPY